MDGGYPLCTVRVFWGGGLVHTFSYIRNRNFGHSDLTSPSYLTSTGLPAFPQALMVAA